MQGASRASLASARERLRALLAGTGDDHAAVADGLFAVADLLDGNVSLRRALTDPSAEGEQKASVVNRLLSGKVPSEVVDLVAGLVRDRWARTRDLPDAIDTLAADTVLSDAEVSGRLDAVEDELFRFRRTVTGDGELGSVFSDRRVGGDRKAALVSSLLDGKVAPQTLRLVRQAVLSPRGQRFDRVLEQYGDLAAERREQLIARVVVPVPMEAAHRERLAAALRQQFGKPVQLQVDVDPAVIGGVRVEIGDQVLDGTVQRRLDDVRQRFAR